MVRRILRCYPAHRIAVRAQPIGLWCSLEVVVQGADSRDVRPFALRLCPDFLAKDYVVSSFAQLACVFDSHGKRVTPVAERDAPIGNSSRFVIFECRVVSLNRTAELKRMKKCGRAIEFLLRFGVARRNKVHMAQLLAGSVHMLLREAACAENE